MRSALFAIFALGTVQQASSEQLHLNSPGRSVVVVSEVKLSQRLRREFRDFRNDVNFYSAWVVNVAEDRHASAVNYHNLAFARADAMSICSTESKNPSECVEYAMVLPRDHTEPTTGTTISQVAQKHFRGKYEQNQRKGTFSVFAINNRSEYGYAWQFWRKAEAISVALLDCEKAGALAKARVNVPERESIDWEDRLECRVVHVSPP